jgi:hypothetical protein
VDGAHSSLTDPRRIVAVGGLPLGTTALSATAEPVAVIAQGPVASAGRA